MSQNEQMVQLPPLIYAISDYDMSSANIGDAVTGMPIPSYQTIYIDGLPRDSRFPERIDRPSYPLMLGAGSVPPEQENLVWQAGGRN